MIWGTQAFPAVHTENFKPCFWLTIIIIAINTRIWTAGFKAGLLLSLPSRQLTSCSQAKTLVPHTLNGSPALQPPFLLLKSGIVMFYLWGLPLTPKLYHLCGIICSLF